MLAAEFNQMSADLARATQLRRQMTADIAHDLRTPLTVLSGYLESFADEVLKPTPARFAILYAETQLLLRLVDDLHTLALADAGELRLAAPGRRAGPAGGADRRRASARGRPAGRGAVRRGGRAGAGDLGRSRSG